MAPTDLTLSEALGQAMAAHTAGDLGEAARLYTAIIDRNGQRPDVLHQLAIVEYQRGRPRVAIGLVDAALALKSDYAEALVSRGNILCALDRPQQALACYDQALSINPNNPGALYNQGYTLQMLGRREDALASYDRALAINPQFVQVFNNRGNLLYAAGRFAQAIESYDRALAIKPGDALVLNNRGSALYALKQWQEALESYHRALTIAPDYFDALYNRGNALREMNFWRGAVASYAKAVTIRPNDATAKFALCMAELPILYADTPEIAERRAAYAERLTALSRAVDQSEAPGDLAGAVGSHRPYYLAYQGANDRDLHGRYGALVCRIMAAHYPPAPLAPPPRSDEPVRVGIVSGFFLLHSNWKLHSKALCSQLDRRHFRVFGYHTGTEQDDETKIAAATCDRFVQGPLSVEAWRQTILADAPHVLIYPEIGMDATSIALAAQRLARVQCNSYGNPDTSGFPTVDYYLSSDLMEPPDGQDHYTERLIRLPNLAAYYEPLDVLPVRLGRAELGLHATAAVYWCGQSLYKYLPQFDSVFARIARGASDCQFVFIEHSGAARVTALFKQRLERAFADVGLRADDYCVILPRLDFPKFVAVFGLCDVFLDSIGWSGANTTLESLAHPMPVVTLAAPMMRGRHTLAILKMMGVAETIAETIEDYIAVAIRLARDVPWRMAVRQRMSANKPKVYRDRTWLSALEELLNRAVREGIESDR